MRLHTFLVPGAGDALVGRLRPLLTSVALDALILFSLGADQSKLLSALSGATCPVYLTETYGILGYDEEAGANVELMEAGRGSEYGFCGGSGDTFVSLAHPRCHACMTRTLR